VTSEMAEGGVVFADGMEADRLEFADGHRLEIRLADQRLALVARVVAGRPAVRRRRRQQAVAQAARA
ncbi:MAG TPA: hypothetical protein VFY49_14930, partial [Myxococcota bacterium]|nr:hypothetical protein [Myxococcota bacterium]